MLFQVRSDMTESQQVWYFITFFLLFLVVDGSSTWILMKQISHQKILIPLGNVICICCVGNRCRQQDHGHLTKHAALKLPKLSRAAMWQKCHNGISYKLVTNFHEQKSKSYRHNVPSFHLMQGAMVASIWHSWYTNKHTTCEGSGQKITISI